LRGGVGCWPNAGAKALTRAAGGSKESISDRNDEYQTSVLSSARAMIKIAVLLHASLCNRQKTSSRIRARPVVESEFSLGRFPAPSLQLARHYQHYPTHACASLTGEDCMFGNFGYGPQVPGPRRLSAKSGWAGRAGRVLLTGSASTRARVLTGTRAGPSVVRSESASSGCKPFS
jgi:hypothetical protein